MTYLIAAACFLCCDRLQVYMQWIPTAEPRDPGEGGVIPWQSITHVGLLVLWVGEALLERPSKAEKFSSQPNCVGDGLSLFIRDLFRCVQCVIRAASLLSLPLPPSLSLPLSICLVSTVSLGRWTVSIASIAALSVSLCVS